MGRLRRLLCVRFCDPERGEEYEVSRYLASPQSSKTIGDLAFTVCRHTTPGYDGVDSLLEQCNFSPPFCSTKVADDQYGHNDSTVGSIELVEDGNDMTRSQPEPDAEHVDEANPLPAMDSETSHDAPNAADPLYIEDATTYQTAPLSESIIQETAMHYDNTAAVDEAPPSTPCLDSEVTTICNSVTPSEHEPKEVKTSPKQEIRILPNFSVVYSPTLRDD